MGERKKWKCSTAHQRQDTSLKTHNPRKVKFPNYIQGESKSSAGETTKNKELKKEVKRDSKGKRK